MKEPEESEKIISLPETKTSKKRGSRFSVDHNLMCLNFLNVDIREALSAIAMEREINIAAAPDVSGNISVHLFGVTLAEALKAPSFSKIPGSTVAQTSRPNIPQGEFTPENVCLTLAALQPENAIIVDEGITTSTSYYPLAAGLSPHSFLTATGGSIGWGIPCSIGASIACPERPVINFQSDGSAMYTVEALWTAAREALNVTMLICANRSYNIIKNGLYRTGITSVGSKALSLIELDRPNINWVKLAEGMGVPAASVNSIEGLANELRKALSEPGPHLIEMIITPPTL